MNLAHIILQDLFISYWKNEPHYQNQIFIGHLYQTIKHLANTIIDSAGAPVCI